MKFSKTAFKEFTRCSKVYPLFLLHTKQTKANVLPYDDDRYEKISELLGVMFDPEVEDSMEADNPQLEAMMKYYDLTEEYAILQANQSLRLSCAYHKNVKEQRSFTYTDSYGNEFYCYLDGYSEDETSYHVIEVKTTTSKKFLELGPKDQSIFRKDGAELKIIPFEETDMDHKQYEKAWEKLYDRYSDVGKYVYDLAVEYYIVQKSISSKYTYLSKKQGNFYLAVLNSAYVHDGGEKYVLETHPEPFVVFINLTAVLKEYISKIDIDYQRLINHINTGDPTNAILGKYCEYNKQTPCGFTPVCWKQVKEAGSVMEYMGIKRFKNPDGDKMDMFELFKAGIIKMDQLPMEYLSNPNHLIQRSCHDENTEYIHSEKILAGVETLQYPIYHLDFESFPCPIPRFKGEKPYCQSVFQYSIHIEREPYQCDIDKDHVSFLASDFSDCREELVQSMIEIIDLSQGGTVMVYNRSFEMTRIKEWMIQFPKYENALKKINDHVFDLLDLLKSNQNLYKELGYSSEEAKVINYYNNNLHGSFSIKKVLPVFSNLSYCDLDVKNGTEAIVAYASFPTLVKEDLEETQKALIEYCKQDTWAMVVVLWGLIEKASERS